MDMLLNWRLQFLRIYQSKNFCVLNISSYLFDLLIVIQRQPSYIWFFEIAFVHDHQYIRGVMIIVSANQYSIISISRISKAF